MHASTVRAVFGLPLPVLHFIADPHTYAYVLILRSSTSSFVSENVEIIVRNVTINDVQLQNSNLEFGIPPISYT